MIRLANIAVFCAAAVGFWLFVPMWRLYPALQPMVTALSIVSAALLVRLNRGMPTVDWKSIDPLTRKTFSAQMQGLVGEYVAILAMAAILTVSLVGLQVVGLPALQATWPDWAQRATASGIGGLSILSTARMTYVVWRDYDIVRAQRTALDLSADADQAAIEAKKADEKVAAMKRANLRAIPASEAEPWEGK